MELTQKEIGTLSAIFEENKVVSKKLIAKNYQPLLENSLQDYFPFSENMWSDLHAQMLKPQEVGHDEVRSIEIIESYSPILLNRDLASISLLRMGCYTPARHDKVTSLMVYDEGPWLQLGIEAALSLCHWRMWKYPPSKWFSPDRFFRLINEALSFKPFELWAASSIYWAVEDPRLKLLSPDEAEMLKAHLLPVVEEGVEDQLDLDLHFMCQLTLFPDMRKHYE